MVLPVFPAARDLCDFYFPLDVVGGVGAELEGEDRSRGPHNPLAHVNVH